MIYLRRRLQQINDYKLDLNLRELTFLVGSDAPKETAKKKPTLNVGKKRNIVALQIRLNGLK